MQSLRRLWPSLTSRTPKRKLAQVHDVIIEVRRVPKKEVEGVERSEMERNVLHQPLQPVTPSLGQPATGYTRQNYCHSPPSDSGNHSVAGILTDAFLDFSASRGNDLRAALGLTAGCKWCLCVSRWKEAFEARNGDEDPKVPRVVLRSTSERALEEVGLEDLRKFAVDGEDGEDGSRAR